MARWKECLALVACDEVFPAGTGTPAASIGRARTRKERSQDRPLRVGRGVQGVVWGEGLVEREVGQEGRTVRPGEVVAVRSQVLDAVRAREDVTPGDLLALGDRVVLQVVGDPPGGASGSVAPPGEPVHVRVLVGGEVRDGDPVRRLRPSRDLAVVVLAGGRSTRFGSDKRRARAGDGCTLLEQAIWKARQVTGEVLLSVGAHEGTMAAAGALTVADEVPDAGPLGGLVASLGACRAPVAVAFAVDQPGVTADLLRVLAIRREGPGVFLRHGEDLHPLPCALDRAVVLPGLASALASGRRALHRALLAVGLDAVEVASLADLGPWEALLTNVNEPRDAESLKDRCPGNASEDPHPADR